MKKVLILFVLLLLISLSGCFTQTFTPATQQSVSTHTPASDIVWADPVIEAEVRKSLMKPEGVPMMRKELQEITSLSLLTGVSNLADLKYFENLEELWIRPYDLLEQPLDLSPIGELKKLVRLEVILSGDGYNLSFLRELPQLTALTIQWPSKGEDIAAISSLINLTKLGLIEMEELDLNKLSNLTRLDELYLKFCNVKSLAPLESLVNLRILALQDSPGLKSLSPIVGMKNLEFLDLTGCSEIESLEPLRGLEKLTEVFMAIDLGLDLSPVAHVDYFNGQPTGGLVP